MKWQTLIRNAVEKHPTYDDAKIARVVIAAASKDDIEGIVATIVKQHRRVDAARLEMEECTNRSLQDHQDWSAAVRRHVVALGTGARVAFGSMTKEMHEVRITMLASQIRGIEWTISLHEKAIYDIEQAGVSCLDELVQARAQPLVAA